MRWVAAATDVHERVDKFIASRLPELSRATVQRWIKEGRVQIDGRPCRARDRCTVGAVIELSPGSTMELSQALPDPTVSVSVLFEDAHLIVVDKPAGQVVHPARGHRSKTLVNGLLARPGFEAPPIDRRGVDAALRPGIVHRLDKDTSGVLVVAKTVEAREGLKQQLEGRTVQRRYIALTEGVPKEGTVNTLHARSRRSRLRFTSKTKQGKRAITRVEVLEELWQGRAARIQCRLKTGRTHQIRVHLSEQLNTPILADVLYGRPPEHEVLRQIARLLGRQALHATSLGFVHPIDGRDVFFESPMPQDMRRALDALRALPDD